MYVKLSGFVFSGLDVNIYLNRPDAVGSFRGVTLVFKKPGSILRPQ